MIDLLRFFLVVVGFVYLVTESGIGAPFRIFLLAAASKLSPHAETLMRLFLYCPACVGFWVGLLAGDACGLYPFDSVPGEAGVVACATMALLAKFFDWSENAEEEMEVVDEELHPKGRPPPAVNLTDEQIARMEPITDEDETDGAA